MKRMLAVFIIMLIGTLSSYAYDKNSTCVKCHSDSQALEKLGYPQLYLNPDEVESEVNMGDINCVDCHLGNNESMDKDEAHKDMPRAFYAAVGKNHKYQAVGREITKFDPIQPKGDVRFKKLLREPDSETAKKLGIKKIIQLYYHDHDPKTMAYSPDIAMKTCGKCHEEAVKEYNESGMGKNKYQRAYTSFTSKEPGPQNCGAWFGDNYDKLKGDSAVDYKQFHADGSSRGCNKCHASCSDCHYQGYKESKARHKFSKEVEPMSCYGSGKGTVCHAGPNDRRRGAGYMREEFAFPVGELSADVHAKNDVSCNSCHTMKKHDFGHLGSKEARESCKNCHTEIYDAVKTSEHGNVDCASCHIKEVGAYQFTFWGPGISEGQKNPYTKHKEYYGIRSNPTLVKHPETGLWIPLKPYPMGVMNINKDVKSTGLKLRTIKDTKVEGNKELGEEDFVVSRGKADVNDMYVINGTFDNLKANNKLLAWIQMDKMSHAIGSGRRCESCHSSHDQTATSWYTYDNLTDVKKPFSGSYTIKGTKKGLFFTNWKNETPVPVDGRQIEDFAPFLVSGNVWDFKGADFSIPFNEKKYADAKGEYDLLYAKIHSLSVQFKKDKEKTAKIKIIKAVLHHNRDKAKAMIAELEK